MFLFEHSQLSEQLKMSVALLKQKRHLWLGRRTRFVCRGHKWSLRVWQLMWAGGVGRPPRRSPCVPCTCPWSPCSGAYPVENLLQENSIWLRNKNKNSTLNPVVEFYSVPSVWLWKLSRLENEVKPGHCCSESCRWPLCVCALCTCTQGHFWGDSPVQWPPPGAACHHPSLPSPKQPRRETLDWHSGILAWLEMEAAVLGPGPWSNPTRSVKAL